MFTGIIEKIGSLAYRELNADGSGIIALRTSRWGDSLVYGESVAVNGVCLSLQSFMEEKKGQLFVVFSVLKETLDRTNLGDLTIGANLNLERALKADGRLGGHFVTGHVDAVCRVSSMEKIGRDWKLIIACGEDILRHIVLKGSVAVDGVSLTVAELSEDFFSVYLIPITMEHTTLKHLKHNSKLNIETDIIGKYVEKHLSAGVKKKIDFDFLKNAGYE